MLALLDRLVSLWDRRWPAPDLATVPNAAGTRPDARSRLPSGAQIAVALLRRTAGRPRRGGAALRACGPNQISASRYPSGRNRAGLRQAFGRRPTGPPPPHLRPASRRGRLPLAGRPGRLRPLWDHPAGLQELATVPIRLDESLWDPGPRRHRGPMVPIRAFSQSAALWDRDQVEIPTDRQIPRSQNRRGAPACAPWR
jgi:hypothetical protein